jgi:hypothetical protein
MAWLGIWAFVFLAAGVILALVGNTIDRDFSRAVYSLFAGGAVSFVVAYFWQYRKGRDTSGFDQGGDGGGLGTDWGSHGHHDGSDGGHGGDGGDGGH